MITEKIQNKTVVATKTESSNQLGYIFWYSVTSDIEVTRTELENLFQEIGIDKNWLPNKIRSCDAFRRATKEVQRKKVPTASSNVFLNYLVREVYSDKNIVQRNIVIETVDQSGKRLSYSPNATVMKLSKDNSDFTIWSENSYTRELAEEAKKRFIKYTEYYSAQQLRVMISKYLSSLAPTAVRPNGGVYFIPQSFHVQLKKLQLLCKKIKSEGVAIPLLDTADNKNLVLSKLENEMNETLERCRELLRSGTSKKQLYKDCIEEARKVAKTFQEYKNSLNLNLENLTDLLDEIRFAAVQLTQYQIG